MKKGSVKFDAAVDSIVLRHQQQDHNTYGRVPDQSVMIFILGQAEDKDWTLLRFNCSDIKCKFIYDTDGRNYVCRTDSSWTGIISSGHYVSCAKYCQKWSRRRDLKTSVGKLAHKSWLG